MTETVAEATNFNVKRVQKLLHHLKTIQDDEFDMGAWICFSSEKRHEQITHIYWDMNYLREGESNLEHKLRSIANTDCGTVACIAGYTAILFIEEARKYARNSTITIEQFATAVLGLQASVADALFYGQGYLKYPCPKYHEITREDAIMVLEHLLKTGTVDWKVAAMV